MACVAVPPGEGLPMTVMVEDAARRERSIRLAVVTSFLSKAGTALLQLLAIPIAVRVLGRAEFGLFTSVNLTLATIAMLEVGVGPALAHGLSRANAKGDGSERCRLASSAFFLMLALAVLAGLALASVLSLVPLTSLYGGSFAGKEDVMRPALWIGLGLFLALFLLNLTDRIREGMLEVASNNLWGAAANAGAAVAVGAGIWFVPEVWFLVLAIHGSMVVAKLANTLGLWRKHPGTRPRFAAFCPEVARHLFGDGFAFASACLVTGLVEYNLCGLMVGHAGGPAEVALYGVFISLTVMQLGFVVMLSAPTWPAVADAMARGDLGWARQAASRLRGYGSGFAVLSAAGMVLAGPWVFRWWLGPEFGDTSRRLLACYGFYFVAHVWRHIHHTLMIGTGQVVRMSRVQFVESAIMAMVAWFALRAWGLEGMLLTMASTMLLFSGRILPRLVDQSIKAPV